MEDFQQAMAAQPQNVEAQVIRVNPPPAPYNQRVLIEFRGNFKKGYEPMSGEEFRPLLS